ncbi:low temperature requirement protein A [Hahella sp. NBU794]|uniref:low temperature requirement protein A n=1 Tax=Hahella sp. NBU794 TaxID=3422590 RepID=UPI003D6F5460
MSKPIGRPSLRTLETPDGGRHASWLELFYDLVIVVSIAQIAHVYIHHPSIAAALAAAGLFCVIFLGWQGFSFYADRFDNNDPAFRIAAFGQMLAMLVLAAQAPHVAEGHHSIFALAFAALRSILVMLYALVWRFVPVAKPLAARYGGVYAFSVCLWIISAFVPLPVALGLWAAAVLLDLAQPWLTTHLHEHIPTDPEHVPERLGLFTIIVLGELIVSVTLGALEVEWSGSLVMTLVCCFIAAVSLWWLYFEQIDGKHLPRKALPIVAYAYSHLPILGALTFVAAGVGVMVGEQGEHGVTGGLWAYCGGLAVFLAAISIAQAQLQGAVNRPVRVARSLLAVALLSLPMLHPNRELAALSTALGLMALVVFEGVICGRLNARQLQTQQKEAD